MSANNEFDCNDCLMKISSSDDFDKACRYRLCGRRDTRGIGRRNPAADKAWHNRIQHIIILLLAIILQSYCLQVVCIATFMMYGTIGGGHVIRSSLGVEIKQAYRRRPQHLSLTVYIIN